MIYLKYLALFLLLSSIAIFFFGYSPKTKYKRRVKGDKSYFKERTIDKVVLVIIDSLSSDMVYKKPATWTSINRYINRSWTLQTIADLQPPSMSLAKIKCIITGAIISFFDIILNTDSGQIAQDNLIDILREHRHFTINFYGDETWSKLFPYQFNYSHSLSPFFIRDFYKVDDKISAHIPQIIGNINAWDFVIIHYLGLDHMGHTVGPFNPSIEKKLSEMDKKTGLLIDGIFQAADSDRFMLILTADHGMSNLGGHGGSSPDELQVPLLFFNKRFQQNHEYGIVKIAQNDIAPSLALLFGVPIPADNIGVIPLQLLKLIDGEANRTDALYSNYFQLLRNIDTLPRTIDNRFSYVNSSLFIIGETCKRNGSDNCCKNEREKCHKELIKIMNDMKVILKYQFVQHNFLMLEFAFMLSSSALLICICEYLIDGGFHVTVPGTVFLLSILFLLISVLFLENFELCFFSAFKISLITVTIILTGHSLTGIKQIIQSVQSFDWENKLTEFVVVLALSINLLGISFPNIIKEEHQVWFYLSTTLSLMYLIKEFIKQTLVKKERFHWKSSYVALALIVVSDRVLRTLNRNGELWSSLPRLGDWLNRSDNSLYLTTIIGACLILVGGLLWQKDSLILSITLELLVLLNAIHRFTDIYRSTIISDISVWTYYTVLVLYITVSFLLRLWCRQTSVLKLSSLVLLITILICRNQNVLLWTVISLKTVLVRQIWLREIRHYHIAIQFLIFNNLAMTSYFQQGNSNSLTTIDVQPGFVGMPRYIGTIIAPLVVIQLFAANLYWIIIWLEWLTENKIIPKTDTTNDFNRMDGERYDPRNEERNPLSKIIHSLTFFSSLFTVIVFFFSVLHKHETAAWSIYAPKILYHSFHHGIILFVYVFIAKLKFL